MSRAGVTGSTSPSPSGGGRAVEGMIVAVRIAVIGLGGMGRALAGRLLDEHHDVAVWNRSPGRSTELAARGARVLDSPDDAGGDGEAVVVCLADDASLLTVAAPDGAARPAWRHSAVVSTSTVSPQTLTGLHELYGPGFVAALILGAPQAVAAGGARWIRGGAPAACAALQPLWDVFAETVDTGDSPARAATVKLLQNQMLLAGLAVLAETVRLGRAAGIADPALVDMLRSSPMVAPGLANRVDGLVDPRHDGWFTSPLAAKDLSHALDLDPAAVPGRHPVTEAARDAYRRVAADGWADVDVTALTELGTPRPS